MHFAGQYCLKNISFQTILLYLSLYIALNSITLYNFHIDVANNTLKGGKII